MLPEVSELLPLVDPQILGRRLQAARLAAGLSATDLGLGDEALGEVEDGRVRASLALLEVVAERAGTSVDVLVTGLPRAVLMDIQGELDLAGFGVSASNTTTALAAADRALERLTGATAPPLARAARRLRASALEAAGDLSSAIVDLRAITAEPLPEVQWVKDLMALCRCYRDTGRLDEAIEVAESRRGDIRALGLAETTEALQLTITTATAYDGRGESGQARRVCKRAAREAQRLGLTVAHASALWNQSLAVLNDGDPEGALAPALEALDLFITHDDTRNLARLRVHIAITQLALQPPDVLGALSILDRAREELERSTASTVDVAIHRLITAQALQLAGDDERAAAVLAESEALIPADIPTVRAWQAALRGRLAAGRGDLDEARGHYQEAVTIMYAHSPATDADSGQLWFELGEVLTELGEGRLALEAYRSAGVARGLRVT
ncbi:hypothetical protein GCM10022237_51240 [Nocardioides ginsengisoli]|uniref:Tetratricopeptide repeat protein n=1 Tax=Nocardioides ginsengisoli TaxID=363868 RepID=A0ABW3VVU9_9ACTN